jgi:NAD(P)-dependent dehydrogenase (short-subunit alcohol dehydrogenase family)
MQIRTLEGKAVVITGGGRGLGAAYSRLAAREGANVVVNDVEADVVQATVNEIASSGGQAVGCVADISRWDDSERLIDSCVQTYGQIDGLVNNAGLSFPQRTPLDGAQTRIDRLMAVNVLGTIYCGMHALRHMMQRRSGSIVNVTSGAHQGSEHHAIYSASKGAVASLTYSWDIDLRDTPIRVNAISPVAATRLAAEEIDFHATGELPDREERIRSWGDPDSVAPAVIYLLSDYSHGINGQVVRCRKGEISLLTRPAMQLPGIFRDSWQVRDVAEAFDNELSIAQMPTGALSISGNYSFNPVSLNK